jgi:PAS domain S-box-containing protein
LIQGASDAIFVADIETGKIIFANPAAAKMFECSVPELQGLHQTELHPKEEMAEIIEKFRQFTTSDNYKETTAHILTKTGKKKLVLITGANLFELDNKKYASAFFKDISYVEKLQEIAFQQSHLVRRPLANILGISKLLSEKIVDTEQDKNELLEQLHIAAQQLDDVIKSVTAKTVI